LYFGDFTPSCSSCEKAEAEQKRNISTLIVRLSGVEALYESLFNF